MAGYDDRRVQGVRGRQDDRNADRWPLWVFGLVVAVLLLLWVVFAPGRVY